MSINDLLPTTPDLRQERLDELRRLFPDLFTNEGRLDPDENTVYEITDGKRTTLACLAWNEAIKDATIQRLRDLDEAKEKPFFICLERSLSTTLFEIVDSGSKIASAQPGSATDANAKV